MQITLHNFRLNLHGALRALTANEINDYFTLTFVRSSSDSWRRLSPLLPLFLSSYLPFCVSVPLLLPLRVSFAGLSSRSTPVILPVMPSPRVTSQITLYEQFAGANTNLIIGSVVRVTPHTYESALARRLETRIKS